MTKIAIVTNTYRKLDGSTAKHLRRTLESVRDQTYQDYKLYLIGDDYSDEDELYTLSGIIPADKLYVENLPVAVERTKYERGKLWYCGGNNANVTGIKRAMADGINYICLLNHDDVFHPDHLETLAKCIEDTGTHFMAVKCDTYPAVIAEGLYTPYRPVPARLYLVSVCMDYAHYGLLPRNAIEEGVDLPSDADLWARVSAWMELNRTYGVFINKNTCDKIGGGDCKYHPEIVK